MYTALYLFQRFYSEHTTQHDRVFYKTNLFFRAKKPWVIMFFFLFVTT